MDLLVHLNGVLVLHHMIISIEDHIRHIIHIILLKHLGVIINKLLQEAPMVVVGKGLLACMVHPRILVVMTIMVDPEAIFLMSQCLLNNLLPFLHMLLALPLLLWVQFHHR